MRKSEARLSLRQKALVVLLHRDGAFGHPVSPWEVALLETQLRSPAFRPLYSPYRIEQSWACTVLPPLERFLRDESRTGAAQPFVCRNLFDRFGSKADICSAKRHVRFTPKSRHVQRNSLCPLCANSGHSCGSLDPRIDLTA